MKRYLLLLISCVCVSIGARAASVSGDGISGATTYDTNGNKIQTMVVSTPGALATWVANHTGDKYDTNNPFEGLGGSADFFSLKISGELNAEDIAALNTATCAVFSRFPRIDLSDVTLGDDVTSEDVCNVVFGHASFDKNGTSVSGDGATYIRMPNSMTSADDVVLMAGMKGKGNTALKMVGAYDSDNSEFDDNSKKWAKVALQSFEENNVYQFFTDMNIKIDGNNQNVPQVRQVRMSGEYGDQDLVGQYGPNFGWNCSAEWDFTGAHFSDFTIDASEAKYYNYDDPFCENDLVAASTSSNSFIKFSQYSKQAIDVKLPDNNMTHLPKGTLYEMGKENANGYKALYGEDALNANRYGTEGVPFDMFVIPDCYTDLDEGCAELARIRHLYVGSGTKRVHGGAFLGCPVLEDLDFAPGLSDCYLGDRAFNQCESMKHIALSEGIVSLGNGCFWNSQHLESIRLPETLINMGNNCFNNCLALSSITIPQNVEKIGQNAFTLCPFTDIFLTTTDPEKIPLVWSAGTDFMSFDGKCTFHHGHLDGWEGGVDAYQNDIDGKMTWDEAAPFYFMHWNGMPVLHFPKQLAEKVRSQISSQYAMKSADDPAYGLPLRVDMDRRDDISGADLGSAGEGKYTRDGWAQFMLMKEFTTDPGGDLYYKEYDDVWYTMCFPFDLTDEQLASAFNETFNIVDFSGVEINKEAKTLTLHFNNVAVTDYKDTDDNHYKRKTDGNGNIVREKDEASKFSYNVYLRDGEEYHHVTTSSQLSTNKTKTFAKGNSMAEAQSNFNSNKEAFMIDGILASAGHPYMIHPAIGVNDGGTTKKRCNFSGVEWKAKDTWAKLFEDNSRTIDLGVAKNDEILPDSNYNQAAYSEYAGQKYTFIGNPKEYIDAAEEAIGEEPDVPAEPVKPVKPNEPTEKLSEPTETIAEPEALTSDEKDLYTLLTDGNGNGSGPWKDETYITANYNDGSTQANNYNSYGWVFEGKLKALGYNIYGSDDDKANAFNFCKSTFNKGKDYENNYAAYQENKKAWDAYYANKAAWEEYSSWNQTEKDAEYNKLKDEYDAAVTAHTAWENKAKSYKVQIPKNAYFLGRAKGMYPKYYREKAEENYGGSRTNGLWPQFTAIIKVNAAAVEGIEKKLDSTAALTKGFEMAFNEDFEGELLDVDEINGIIEEAEKQGDVQVEYMDVVVNINGQIVRSGSTSLEGLPRGLYIINGKKYFVK